MGKAGRSLLKCLGGIVGIVALVALAKACQYAAVDRLGPRLGFDAASTIGLVPFFMCLIVVNIFWRRRRIRQ